MEEFVQEFKQATRGSGYEGRPLVEEFKRGMNGRIRRKLIEAENPPTSIEQWYRRAMVLWDTWDMNNFYFLFLFLLFSDFIGILFSFSFLFFWIRKRHMTSQSHDMSHDMMS